MGMRERRRAAQEHLARQAERVAELLPPMKPGRYRFPRGESMYICVDCGAIVGDTVAHDAWHNQ